MYTARCVVLSNLQDVVKLCDFSFLINDITVVKRRIPITTLCYAAPEINDECATDDGDGQWATYGCGIDIFSVGHMLKKMLIDVHTLTLITQPTLLRFRKASIRI